MANNGHKNQEPDHQKILNILNDHDDKIQDLEMATKKLYSAFPSGDVDGHRRYHDLIIQRNLEIRQLRIAIQEKTLSGLAWGSMAFLGFAVWNYIKYLLGKG